MAAILAFPLRVEDQAWRRTASKPRHARRVRHRAGLHMRPAVGGDNKFHLAPGLDALGLVRADPGVLYCGSFAMYAVAFPRMSRSMRSRAFSARKRASSICSGDTGLSLAPDKAHRLKLEFQGVLAPDLAIIFLAHL